MLEKEIRRNVVEIAQGFLGCKESDGSHRKIIDMYNESKPLARGYKMGYADAWCACFVSVVALKSGLVDIIPKEVSCNKMIELYKGIGRWEESDAYVPNAGDIIFYDWDDTGAGDNKGASEHVGIVVSVVNGIIKVIEGNMANAVGYRNIAVNGRYIRGYGLPNYAIKATAVDNSLNVVIDNNFATITAKNVDGYFVATLSEMAKLFPEQMFKIRDIMGLSGCYHITYDGENRKITATQRVITEEEFNILYKIVQAEAGGEDEIGKILVCNVIFNRMSVKGFPDTIKDVVFEPMQFQPTRDGAYEKAVPRDATKVAVNRALSGADYSQGATYFCSIAESKKLDNFHEKKLTFLFEHGGHRFYKP